jgi:hypothetical protein
LPRLKFGPAKAGRKKPARDSRLFLWLIEGRVKSGPS